jgi:sec-independent protein translocase protein TatC
MSDKEFSFIDHLEELRRRIIVSLLCIVAVAAVVFFLSDSVLRVLLLPSGGMKLRAFSIMDGFLIKLRIALYAGIAATFPVWAYQLFRFVDPGLRPGERRVVWPVLVCAIVLFTGGTAFGYSMLWGMIRVLTGLFPSEVEFLPSAESYLSFVVFFLLACGLAFELPCVLVLLVHFRILSVRTLRSRRRIAYFALFVFAEIVTPVADPIVAPMTVMIPLLILYEASVFVGGRLEAARGKEGGEPARG